MPTLQALSPPAAGVSPGPRPSPLRQRESLQAPGPLPSGSGSLSRSQALSPLAAGVSPGPRPSPLRQRESLQAPGPLHSGSGSLSRPQALSPPAAGVRPRALGLLHTLHAKPFSVSTCCCLSLLWTNVSPSVSSCASPWCHVTTFVSILLGARPASASFALAPVTEFFDIANPSPWAPAGPRPRRWAQVSVWTSKCNDALFLEL